MSLKIGALWLKKTQEGKNYMSGIIQFPGTELQFAVFKNEDKQKDNQPDYNIVWSPEKKNKNTQGAPEQMENNQGDGIPF